MIDVEIDARSIVEGVRRLLAEIDRQTLIATNAATSIGVNVAKANAPQRTGALANSIKSEGAEGSFISGTLVGVFGAAVPYASFLELGTKDAAPYEIRPKRRKVLRWPQQGFIGPLYQGKSKRIMRKASSGYVFAKIVLKHPGIDAHPFLQPAVDEIQARYPQMLDKAIVIAAVSTGFSK